jgi:dTDP-4-dehydrorhamnose reductase
LLGAGGQLGRALVPALEGLAPLVALGRREADLADPTALEAVVARVRPAVIVNAGAYTAVDRAEGDVALAEAVNARAPGVLGALARRHDATVVHYSTDYVFDGTKDGAYGEDDPTAPLSVYGRTKRDGERALAASGARQLTLRTSWVVGREGANFARTMLRLARERDSLKVVADQHGVPTPAPLIARVTAGLLGRLLAGGTDAFPYGLYHLVPGGETTWYHYACHVLERAAAAGVALRTPASAVVPIPSSEYPTPARRPRNSRLSTARLAATFGVPLPMWQDALAEVLPDLFAEALNPP